MAVVFRKRICTSFSEDHYWRMVNLCYDYNLKQSALLEIALDYLKLQLDGGIELKDIEKMINSNK